MARPFVRLKFLFNALVLISAHVIWVYALGSGVKTNTVYPALLDIFVHWKRYAQCAFL